MSQVKESKDSPYPKRVALLAFSNSILLPGSLSKVTLEGKKSLEIIGQCAKKDNFIGIVQNTEYHHSPTFFTIGTLAKVTKVLDLTHESIDVQLEGIAKFEVKEFIETPYQFYEGNVCYDSFDKKTNQFNGVVDRESLLKTFQKLLSYLDFNDFDLNLLDNCSNENLLKELIEICPMSHVEKQYILETNEIGNQTKLLMQYMEETMMTPLFELTKH